MKKVFKFFLGAVLSLGFFSCSNSITEKNETLYLSALIQNSAVKYGSIVISNDSARALDLSTITSASVTVSGYGMSDVTGSVTLSSGQGSGTATVENIPVGSNRVVTLKSNVDGAVIRAVCDIASGSNDVTVSWDSTAVANVYYYLIKDGADVSAIESDSFSEKIPDVHPALFDAETFASDFKSANYSSSSMTAGDYISDYGSVTVNTSGCSGFKFQITDIASEVTSITSDSQSFSLKAYPGSWKVWVYDSNGTLLTDYIKSVTVASGYESTVDIIYTPGGEVVTGKIIVHVPSSLGYSYIWAWNPESTSTNYTGGTWPGASMGSASDGYYTYTLDSITCAAIIFNNGSGGTIGSCQTNDLYITEGEWNYIGGASGTKDSSGTSIASNFESCTTEESFSVTVTNPDLPCAPSVTCNKNNGAEVGLSESITFTVTSENTELTSGTYTIGSYTGSLSVGTNTIKLSDAGITSTGDYNVTASVQNSVGSDSLSISITVVENAEPSTPTRLGAFYESCATSFSIWSPDSSNVKVAVKKQGESDFTEYTCTAGFTVDGGYSDTSNIYGVTVSGDCNLAEYQFYIGGVAVRDPYGKMVKYVKNNYPQDENVICNNTNFYTGGPVGSSWAGPSINIVVDAENILPSDGSWADRPSLDSRCDSVVYEVHVQDFTSSSTWNGTEAKRGKFPGMVESGTTYTSGSKTVKTGLDHLVELGVTHVQIMPMYDFATKYVNTTGEYYNWGYDPVNYNVPEDRYSTCPGDYVKRIQEVKDMVNEFHKAGIRVVMDVVYNHTFANEMFENITDKYYTSSDLSGCGNSVDVSNSMVSRMVRDSLEYWAEVYNIDGFRFDLMAIFTKNALYDWGDYLNNTNSETKDRNLLMQGEPWQANNNNSSDYGYASAIPSLANAHIGCFAGKWRETLKGASDDGNTLGYIFSGRTDHDGDSTYWNTTVGLRGSGTSLGSDTEGVWTRYFTSSPEQAVNYLMAHDNLCFYDKIAAAGTNYTSYADAIVKFGHGILLSAQGIPFIHCGDEFLRTKAVGTFASQAHNSYMWGIEMNQINWSYKATNIDCFNYHKDMIAFRKANDGLRYRNGVGSTTIDGNVIYYTVTNSSSSPSNASKTLTCVINPGSNITVSGKGTQVMNKTGAVSSSSTTCEGTGVTIFCSN